MCRPAFDALDRSWETLVHSPEGGAALARWSEEPALAAPDLETLVERIWAATKPDADRAHAALAARAATDLTAARVLLQVLRPGLRNLGRRLALGGRFDDVDVEVLTLAWERIRTYPIERRPSAIAANVLLDIRKQYIRQVTEAKRLHFEYLSEDLWPPSPSAESEALDSFEPSLRRAHAHLVAAVDSGTISRVSASVLWRTRVQEDDETEVAADLGVNVRTLQRRRQRAERQLAASVTAA